jgi:hypothetical protein
LRAQSCLSPARCCGRLNQRLDLPNLRPHIPTDPGGLARIVPVLEISVAIAPRATRTSSAAVHTASSLAGCLTVSATAQLLAHKDLSTDIAFNMAEAAVHDLQRKHTPSRSSSP